MRRIQILVCLTVLGASGLRADFSYEQTSKITGGMMASAMKVVGVFSKSAREPMQSTVMIKGDRMANVSGDSISLVDLNSETITNINTKNRTYSVVTFAQMQQYLNQMAQKAAGSKKKDDPDVEMSFKASVKNTGDTKTIQGMDTRRTILTMEVQGQDKKSGEGGAMNIVTDMWLAKEVPGYDEAQQFYTRMAQKLAWNPSGILPGMAQAQGMGKGMGELYKEMAKLEGVPVFQVVKMGLPPEALEGAAQAPPPGEQAESKPAESSPSRGDVLRGLGGVGGLGGFGRRGRKAEEPKEETLTPEQRQAAVQSGLLELTTEMTNFSTAAVDPSRFEVPAGFKQVQSDMEKALR
jgi:hypothetical protein